ncbi:hypothetical protein HRI_000693200 [Hibiscus trionum]|uniref:Endonuclease/exonuclease/phosphatase domain-containing protein n=1 Tax=Hibiscus trionum TaxID=183268 RepID=A0A9W7H365_HIBTR|nr:hypothetical protein HRI_000693200 [Hibiscus trionum]
MGAAGGLLSIWNSAVFKCNGSYIHKNFIASSGYLVGVDQCVGFINIYGPSVDADKQCFFGELLEFLSNKPLPWCLVGDFNAIVSREEKIGMNFNCHLAEIFRSFIQDANLMDLPLHGGAFTWSNRRDPPTFVRLDRVLVHHSFIILFNDLRQLLLPSSVSDHNAICLEDSKIDWGPRPFKLFNYMLEEEKFQEMVVGEIDVALRHNPNLDLFSMLKRSKRVIKDWSHTISIPSASSVKEVEGKITRIEQELQGGLVSSNMVAELASLKKHIWDLLRTEERIWAQKSRSRWLVEGDRNSKYFHSVASNKRRINSINTLDYKGSVITNPMEIRNCVFEFFSEAYNTCTTLEVESLDLEFRKLPQSYREGLEKEFTMEEV